MNQLKQSIGIDISKATFTACLCSSAPGFSLTFSQVVTFKNDKNGYNQLVRWVRKNQDKSAPLVYLMEATGVYYEHLAHHLFSINQVVHVVLPNTSKHYFSSLNIKTKTDAVDAKVLSRFGVEREHNNWSPPSKNLLNLRNLTRYYVQLQEQKTALLNIKHSKEHSVGVQDFILTSNEEIIEQTDEQMQKVKKKIKELISEDESLQDKVDKLLTIKGLGLMTIATIISETNGFEHINNRKQLASYAGYDVVQRESGTSIKGKTRISKKGNRYIRKALYFPAMVACRYNSRMKDNYLRIIQKKPSKMIGQVAIQRKLLLLVYALWKKDETYNEEYQKNKIAPPIDSEAIQDRKPEVSLP